MKSVKRSIGFRPLAFELLLAFFFNRAGQGSDITGSETAGSLPLDHFQEEGLLVE